MTSCTRMSENINTCKPTRRLHHAVTNTYSITTSRRKPSSSVGITQRPRPRPLTSLHIVPPAGASTFRPADALDVMTPPSAQFQAVRKSSIEALLRALHQLSGSPPPATPPRGITHQWATDSAHFQPFEDKDFEKQTLRDRKVMGVREVDAWEKRLEKKGLLKEIKGKVVIRGEERDVGKCEWFSDDEWSEEGDEWREGFPSEGFYGGGDEKCGCGEGKKVVVVTQDQSLDKECCC